MRTFLIFLLAMTFCACKSQKDITSNQSVTTDSVARSSHHRTMAAIDSLVRNIDFSFDTLIIDFKSLCPSKEINIERPYIIADTVGNKSEIIRIKAVNGRVIDRRRIHRNQVEVSNQLDTVAYHQSAAETSTEHTTTTRLYNPPDGTIIIIVAILAAGILIYLIRRYK